MDSYSISSLCRYGTRFGTNVVSIHGRIFLGRQRCLGLGYEKPNLGFEMDLWQCIPISCKPLRTK